MFIIREKIFVSVFIVFVTLGIGIIISLWLVRRCIGGSFSWIVLWIRTSP